MDAQNSYRNCEENSKKFSVKNFPTYAFHKTFSFPEKQNKFSRMSKLSTKYKLVLLPDQPSFFKVEGSEGERGATTAEDQSQKTQSFHY
jgi:hypothetical protein